MKANHVVMHEGASHLVQVSHDGKLFHWSNGKRAAFNLLPQSAEKVPPNVTASTVNRSNLHVAIGFSTGIVIVVDLGSAQQVKVAVDKASVLSLFLDAQQLLVGADNGTIYKFPYLNGVLNATFERLKEELEKVTALSAVQHFVYAATKNGTRLKCIDASSGAVVTKWPQCPTPPIRSVMNLGANDHASDVLYASNDRQLHYFPTTKSSTLLVGRDAPVYVEANSFRAKGKAPKHVLVLESSGVVSIFVVAKSSNATSLKPVGKVALEDGSKIVAASFAAASTVILVGGSVMKPLIETAKYVDASDKVIVKVTVRVHKEEEAVPISKLKKPSTSVTVHPSELLVAQAKEAHSTPVPASAGDELLSFGERLKTSERSTMAIPAADSLENALIQALKTKDIERLNVILQTTDAKVVQKTVNRLPHTAVVPLLQYAVERFQTHPNSAVFLTNWIHLVITTHIGYLASVPDLPTLLGPLYGVIEARLAVFHDLIRLQGRLNLVMTQVKRQKPEPDGLELSSLPLNVFKDDGTMPEDRSSMEEVEDDDEMGDDIGSDEEEESDKDEDDDAMEED